MSHPIDTRLIMEKLTQTGVPPEQADAHAQIFSYALQEQDKAIMQRACSKQDLNMALEPIYQSITDLTITAARLDARIDVTNAQIASLTTQIMARFDATNAKIDSAVGKLKGEWITWLLAFGLLQTALVGGVLLKLVP